VSDSLDEAKAAFRAAWKNPLSEAGADVICHPVLVKTGPCVPWRA
jgi:hypothetical protein